MNIKKKREQRLYWLIARVFLPFALGYFLSYLYRTVNAVIGPNLVDELSIGAGGLGLLTSAYFIAFAAAQLPLGFFLDSRGPRRTVAILLLVAAAGSVVFSLGQGLWGLVMGRALIGLGVAACLMAAFKAMGEWFPLEKLPMANGFIMASGGLGAITATAPTQYLVVEIGWRNGFLILALATLFVSMTIWLFVPEKSRDKPTENITGQIRDLRKIYGKLVFWRLAPITALSQGTFLAIQTLWAGPWLRDIAKLTPDGVSITLLFGAIGFVFGNVFIGVTTVWLAKKNIEPITVVGTGMMFFIIAQFVVIIEWTSAPNILWFIFGMLGSIGVLSFSVLSKEFDGQLIGRATTGMNLLIFVAAFSIQWAIGEVINLWPTAENGGYDAAGYRYAVAVALVLQFLALFWMAFAKRIKRF